MSLDSARGPEAARVLKRTADGSRPVARPGETVSDRSFDSLHVAPISAVPASALTRWIRGVKLAGVLSGIAIGLSGCQSMDMDGGTMAQLRLIDASPDAPNIDSYQNNSALAYNLGFGTMTSYVPMTPGSYTLSADKAGTRQTLVASTATLSAGHQYTGIVGNIDAAMQQTVLVDQSTPAPPGEIAVRLVDQSTRAGAMDVYLIPEGGKLTTTAPTATNLSFGSNSGYIGLPAGTYEIEVLPAGTVPVSTTVTLLSGAQVEYASGAVRTVVLIDTAETAPRSAAATRPPAGVQAIIADDCEPPNE